MKMRDSCAALLGGVVVMGLAPVTEAGIRADKLVFGGQVQISAGDAESPLTGMDTASVLWEGNGQPTGSFELFGGASAFHEAPSAFSHAGLTGSFGVANDRFDGRVAMGLRSVVQAADVTSSAEFGYRGRFDFTITEDTSNSGLEVTIAFNRLVTSVYDGADWNVAVRFEGADFDFTLAHDESSPDELSARFQGDFAPGNYSLIFEGSAGARAEWPGDPGLGGGGGGAADGVALLLNFSVATLPSPGAGMLFSMAGLVALRRRR